MADLPQRGNDDAPPPVPRPNGDVPARTVPSDHLLPPGGSKLSRITQHSKGLVDDLTTWVDLRIKLAKLEVQEEVQKQKNQIALMATVGVLGALGGLFALFALAYGAAALFALFLSWPLSLFLGFLVVTLLLLGLAGAIYKAQPTFFEGEPHVAVDEEDVRPGPDGTRPGDRSPDRPSTPAASTAR